MARMRKTGKRTDPDAPAGAHATCGLDIGARTVKVVLWDPAKDSVIDSAIADSGPLPQNVTETLYQDLLARTSLRPRRIVATGYGRHYCTFADKQLTEITCHARGVRAVIPQARSIIDVGGQDSKVILLDEAGRLQDFAMNDRCAAGTGSFIELVARRLGMSLEEMAQAALRARSGVEITSMCAVFAETEIVGLLQSGRSPEAIARGVFEAIAARIASLAGKMQIAPALVFTGGVALNAGMVSALERQLSAAPLVPPQPQLTGALGAAIIAAEET